MFERDNDERCIVHPSDRVGTNRLYTFSTSTYSYSLYITTTPSPLLLRFGRLLGPPHLQRAPLPAHHRPASKPRLVNDLVIPALPHPHALGHPVGRLALAVDVQDDLGREVGGVRLIK